MNRRLWSIRRLAPLGVLALVAGAAGAQAAGGGMPAERPHPPRASSAPAPAVAAPAPAPAPRLPAPIPRVALVAPPAYGAPAPACRPPGHKPAAAPPSDALKDAFAILRRERTEDDALPARVATALKARGLRVVDPEGTRLLRADRRARAWVVPVPDVAPVGTVVCRGPRAASARRPSAPREGLVVVSVNGAPAGGGGALRDLQRGLASPALDPCAGSGRNMLGVSGIVPDGVEAVFVTAPDGSATRADVRDNGYSFVLPRPRRPEPRYVVWTGSNGTPHVQPLPVFLLSGRSGACPRTIEPIRVTPEPWGAGCAPEFAGAPLVTHAVSPPRPRMTRPARPRAGRPVPLRPAPAAAPPPTAPAPLPLPFSLCAGVSPPTVVSGRVPPPRVPRVP